MNRPVVSRGMLLMLLAAMLLSTMHAIVRHLGSELHPFEISFFRNLFGLLAVLPMALRTGARGLVSRRPDLQLLRGLLGVIAMLGWFYALSVVPIADATALSFLAVIFASLGAVVFLQERMDVTRWLAILSGFVGALIILRPGFASLSIGLLLVIVSSFCWGSAMVVVKQLSKTDSVVSIVTWMAVMLTLLSLPPALWVWRAPTPAELGWLALIGVLGTGGHLAMTRALKISDTSSVVPLDYTRLIWAGFIGFVVFGETPDFWTVFGGCVIAASATYLILRESARR